MIKVGLTGGIGSGKSYVGNIFKHLGIPVFSADVEAKELINTHPYIKAKMKAYFGNGIYLENGVIHRKKLADIIFKDKIALQKVNGIIHPAVRNEFNEWAERQVTNYVIQEAAILFENKQNIFFDKIITVTAPIQTKIERVMKRDNVTSELILQRISNQLDDKIKMEKSDFIIYNYNNKMILPQVISIHEKLK